ncbi:MAG: PIG-L family deacetylase [Chloroflexota bacterium]
MAQPLLGIFAHPDDEILGPGATLAMYAAQGVPVELVCATRGEVGEIADPALATPQTLPQVRERELRCAANTLGIADVTFLGYRDSGMAGTPENEHPQAFINAPAKDVVAQLVAIVRRKRPFALLTFEPYGGYGHPDHIAIHHHTVAAFAAAADPAYRPDLGAAWQTERLFYPLLPPDLFPEMRQRLAARGQDVSFFDGIEERRSQGWPADQIHVQVNVAQFVDAKWDAFLCHRTQFGENSIFRRLPENEMKELLQTEYFALAQPEPASAVALVDLFAPLPQDFRAKTGQ